MNYWIKQRNNPQTGTYYVKMGKMTKKEAKEWKDTRYGYNYMLPFKTLEEYENKIKELTEAGKTGYSSYMQTLLIKDQQTFDQLQKSIDLVVGVEVAAPTHFPCIMTYLWDGSYLWESVVYQEDFDEETFARKNG